MSGMAAGLVEVALVVFRATGYRRWVAHLADLFEEHGARCFGITR